MARAAGEPIARMLAPTEELPIRRSKVSEPGWPSRSAAADHQKRAG